MPDPAAEPDAASLAPFERAADELEERVGLLLAELTTQPERSRHGH